MSKLVCQMKKVKRTGVRGYQIHNLRELESKTNPDIDPSLSYLNRDFINPEPINFMEKWKETFESQNTSERALRKDAVFYNEFIIGSDRDFFKDLDQNEKERFFEVATDFFKERYGEQNVLYSIAHFDETKGSGAHAHVAIVPMRDGKLQSKNVFDRQELRFLQDELPKALQKAGFEIERGREGSKAKHIETATFKVLKAQEAVAEAGREREVIQGETQLLEAKLKDLEGLFDQVEEIDTLEYEDQKNLFGKETGKIVMDRSDFEEMRDIAMMNATLEFENKQLQRKSEVLESEIVQKNRTIDTIQKKYELASSQAERYKKGLDDVIEERLEERISEKTEEIQAKSRQEIGHYIFKLRTLEDDLVKTDRQLQHVSRNVETLEAQKRSLAEENKTLVEENAFLKAKAQELFDYINDYKAKVNETINQRVKEMLGVLRKSIHRATKEWLVEKLPDDKRIGLDHLLDEKKIDKRSEVIAIEIAQEQQSKKQNRELDQELER